ncbi:alpha/beta hydrolase [Adhaeribacter radiodurans]|uniref:Alpha/beta hydrolase n=1 Tax=Adhaeribacter radiodurans TaxID=2745197 RepID=A0A7L7L2Q6_9BACT|nr:alpha/beta hydrolase [Adhaeribacter radiodurans]QMU27074.1 alpha/beta hydrolase [Adhaeribacter radiodurans]
MKKTVYLLFWCWLLGGTAVAQRVDFPRDTSFTVVSAFKNIKKQYPIVKPVLPKLPAGVKSKENIVYRSLGQRALHLDVFYPAKKTTKGYPGVLLIHGGGWRAGDKSMEWPMAQQLAAQGYIAVTAEYRLSLEAPYPAAVHDLKAALRWLRAHGQDYNLDTSKIAIYGTSAGGQLAALVGTTNGSGMLEEQGEYRSRSNKVQAIVDVDGVLAFKHPESKEGTVAAQWLGGTSEEAPDTWAQASALTHTGKNTPPVLFIASSHLRFHAGKADMIKILESHGIYYESYLIPDTPHTFWLFEPWFKPTLQYTVNFLNKVFKGKPLATSEKNKTK